MDRSVCFLLITVISAVCTDVENEKLVVTTNTGSVRGFHLNSRAGRGFYAFTKIPYAKPPVGELRFKKPLPAENWEGILDADKDLPNCWQISIYDPIKYNETFGDEDCLYLNVFTPKISEDSNLPVMVFIHGGGWRTHLPANSPPSRAKYLMDENVVVVEMQYRLGILGFLSLEDSVLPGNLGLRDQSLAIQWVSKNIQHFGGDPKKIKLFGNSAGGASTHYHLISPMTKDIIQGGISQSGTATCFWALSPPGIAAVNARRVAKHLECESESSEDIVKCLQTKQPKDITDAERIFNHRDFDPPTVFQPVIEKGLEDAFLPDSPYNLPVEKPWIVGLTSDDGAFKIPGYKARPELMTSFQENPVEILPNSLCFLNTTTRPFEIAAEVVKKYYNKEDIDKSISVMYTDGFFLYGIDKALKLAKGPKYLYLFGHRGKTSFMDIIGEEIGVDLSHLGVPHTDELLYLFNFEDELKNPDMKTELDHEVSKKMVHIWAKFAKDHKSIEEEWPQHNEEDEKYLKILNENSIDSKLWAERFEFWRKLGIRDKMEAVNV